MIDQMQRTEPVAEGNPACRPARLPLIVAGVALLALGYSWGVSGQDRTAQAQSSTPATAPLRIHMHTPPVISIPKDGVAIIGAEDDRYYIVGHDGSTRILTGVRREDLTWRQKDFR